MLGEHAGGARSAGRRSGHGHLAGYLGAAEVEQRELREWVAQHVWPEARGGLKMGVAQRRDRAGDRRQIHRRDSGGVGGGPAQHVLGVRHRVVVAQNRGQHLGLVAQVQAAAAQVASCRQAGIEHVLRVGPAVTVGVCGIPRPCPG